MAKKKKRGKKKPKVKREEYPKEPEEVKETKPEKEKIEETKEETELEYKKEIIKTFLPLIFGIIAGIVSFLISGNLRSRDPMGIIVLVLFIYINKFLFPRFGIKPQGKDWAGIAFMTFTTWYIVWTILLNL